MPRINLATRFATSVELASVALPLGDLAAQRLQLGGRRLGGLRQASGRLGNGPPRHPAQQSSTTTANGTIGSSLRLRLA
eukprot:6349875-Pyramimonas_sp.AAC.1